MVLITVCVIRVGRVSVVNTATRYELEDPRIEFRCGRDFPNRSRQAVGRSQLRVQWVPGAGTGRWPPSSSSAEVKESVELCLYPLLHDLLWCDFYLYLYLYRILMMLISCRDFTPLYVEIILCIMIVEKIYIERVVANFKANPFISYILWWEMRNPLVQSNLNDTPTLINCLIPSLYQAPSISVGHSDAAIMCIGLVHLLHNNAISITTSLLVTLN